MKSRNLARGLVIALVAAQLSACALHSKPFPPMTRLGDLAGPREEEDKVAANGVTFRQAIDGAVRTLTVPLNDSHRASPVIVGTVTDLTDLQVTRALGQSISEQVVSSLVSRGFSVRDIRLRSGVSMRSTTGELLLTRELQDLMRREHLSGWVVVGTYSVAEHTTFVQLRTLRLSDSIILSTASFELTNDANIRALLRSRPKVR